MVHAWLDVHLAHWGRLHIDLRNLVFLLRYYILSGRALRNLSARNRGWHLIRCASSSCRVRITGWNGFASCLLMVFGLLHGYLRRHVRYTADWFFWLWDEDLSDWRHMLSL